MTRIGLYSDSDLLGGAERSLLNLVAAYHGRADLTVLSPSRRLLDEVTARDGVNTHRVTARSGMVRSALDLRRQLRGLELDLLQVNLANPFACRDALAAGILAGIPTVAVEHLVFPSRRRSGRLAKRLVTRFQAGTVAVGEASADDLTRWFGIPRSTISVVHNGVPDRGEGPPRRTPPPVVGCAARLERQKGVDLLLAAMAQVPDTRLVIVGDGTEREDLRRRAGALGIADRVDFVGWQDDARPAIESFDVFALGSRDEAFPLTIVEAMLGGTPVVATDVGSVAEAVVQEETGLLVPPGDVPALAGAIRRLLDDDALRGRLASAARARAEERFTDVAMARGYDALWSSLLAR